MKVEDCQLCEAVLSSGTEIGRLSLVKVMRNGSLLLALPLDRKLAWATLALYQPQRWTGRLLHRLIQACVFFGIHRLMTRCEVSIGSLGLLSGLEKEVKFDRFGFLLGSVGSPMRNLIGLYELDGFSNVVKAGCGEAADVVRREYALMRGFGELVAGVPECRGVFDIEDGAAYVAELVCGKSPRGKQDDAIVFDLLKNWLGAGTTKVVSDLDCWSAMWVKLSEEQCLLIGEMGHSLVKSPVMHGDFAPWNIKIDSENVVKTLDWEFGTHNGMPGWDWIHYHVQRMKLVEGASANEIMDSCLSMLEEEPMNSYLATAGLIGMEGVLLGSYLYHSGYVLDYPRTDLIDYWEVTEQTV